MSARKKTGTGVRRKDRPPDDKQQSQRFVETGRKLGIDDKDSKPFVRAIATVIKPMASLPKKK